jgi:hypothetical protein
MVIRSVIVFSALFLAYNIALVFFEPDARSFQNQWQRNAAVAEDYVHHAGSIDVVLVGSSMVAKLEDEMLDPGYYNLRFAAGSSSTGLEIIIRAWKLPCAVLIETNLLMDIDTAFVDRVFQPVSLHFKEWLPASGPGISPPICSSAS